MITIKSINVINNLSLDYLIVKFTCDDTTENLADYVFDIYRSQSPEGPFEIVAQDLSSFEYIDNTVNLYKTSVKYYYKVKVKNIVTLEEQFSDIIGQLLSHNPDNIANTVIHEYNVYLDNVVDNPEYIVLIKKRFGQKCNVCWDDVRMQPRTTDCLSCYGTGYTGGYLDPIRIKGSNISGEAGMQISVDTSDVGESKQPIQIWIKNYPIVQPGDIIIDNMNRRYEINQWKPTVKNGYILRQILTMYELPPSNVAYKIPIYKGVIV